MEDACIVSTPRNLSQANEMIANLQMEVRSSMQDARHWRRFLAIEKWMANLENVPHMGDMLLRWEDQYDRDIEAKCSGKG